MALFPIDGALIRGPDECTGVVVAVYPTGAWEARFHYETCTVRQGYPPNTFAELYIPEA